MKKTIWVSIIVVLVLAGGALAFYQYGPNGVQKTESNEVEIENLDGGGTDVSKVNPVDNNPTPVDKKEEIKPVDTILPDQSTGICGKVTYSAGAEGFGTSPLITNVQVLSEQGKLIAETKTNDKGEFKFSLYPGKYLVKETTYDSASWATVSPGTCASIQLIVAAPSSGR
jgi:hypothetical protein